MSNSIIISNLTSINQKKKISFKIFVKALTLRANSFYEENVQLYACLTCLAFSKHKFLNQNHVKIALKFYIIIFRLFYIKISAFQLSDC